MKNIVTNTFLFINAGKMKKYLKLKNIDDNFFQHI